MAEHNPDDSTSSGAQSSRYRHLIAHIQDAVVEFEFINDVPIVSDVNNSFVEIFGFERTAIVGDPLNEWIVPEWKEDEAEELDRRSISGEINYRRVKRKTSTGLREFLYRGIPYEMDTRPQGGFAVYTDLTELNWSEQRFDVLNRILRHNLRNRTNIISGYLSNLFVQLSGTDAEETEVEETLRRAIGDLERLIEEADAVRQVVETSGSADTVVDCVQLIQNAVGKYRRSHASATIETELPDAVPIHATSSLRYAIESLIDNAIRHNPASSPYVRIRVEDTEFSEWVSLYVEDDAPIIPAMEKNVITGTAEITPTYHGAGLGLWLVKWTAEVFGGELLFEKSTFGGNSVHLRLPK
jgi:PAS domain S-box-containing protein